MQPAERALISWVVPRPLGPERLEAEMKLGEVGELQPFVEGLLERLEALR